MTPQSLPQPAVEDLDLSDVLHALSDHSRRTILTVLASGPCRCGSLGLPLAKSTVSHHFKVLRECGLIHVEARGNTRTATLRRDDIEQRFPGLLAVTGILDAALQR
ncbi:DNA-binding transcriptional regulator, ArsR family [Propionibacterium cyclohexanicum]|uniref:DNA-binding transcriptional regulator, ArsR family n=1 Tax=Propionibacterium cyclohexanicum TaxID=64702 RepID=A0A1H9RJT0_9ACTN|nr:ArsR family transcriptional regulator [Propionibacterium cyclohexanicum]SER72293.1 DNA-binding transcriptional regulator, ArsR family [Propionibacterium cyclohexanicum]